MQVTVVLDQRFRQTPDGAIWTDGPFPRSFFDRYLQVFERVRIVARAHDVSWARPAWQRVDGDAVHFHALPCYVGPTQYLRVRGPYRRAIRESLCGSGAFILRTPAQAAGTTESMLTLRRRPFAVEVVGDPYDAFAPGASKHPLRPFFRRLFTLQMRRQCHNAAGAAYVTREALQKRYPARPDAFTNHYSSIELPDDALASQPRPAPPPGQAPRLIHVGSLEHLYKSPDILLAALGNLRRADQIWPLTIVGGGRLREHVEQIASRHGVAGQVTFAGQLSSREEVFAQLDQADLFVLPSRQEGLPRAMIEAMARGLPCIGSSVGGIPELLDADHLVPPDNIEALADALLQLGTDRTRMAASSATSLDTAKEYCESALSQRRNTFYRQLKDASASH